MLKIQKLFDAFIILYFLNIIQIKEVKKLKKNIWVVIFIITVLGCKNSEKKAPVAAIKPDTLRIHGVELIDNYSWLRDDSRNNEEVLKYFSEEAKAKFYRTALDDLPKLLKVGVGTYHLHTDRGDIAVTTVISREDSIELEIERLR